MKRINEAIAERYNNLTKGQRMLATFITEHCDKAAFLSSFELAGITGLSQSTVVRFSTALGYKGYTQFQAAMQDELKYRLSALEKFELMSDDASDLDFLKGIAVTDAMNIKKNAGANQLDAMKNLCTRLMLASKVYVYGQEFAAPAASYLASYLQILLHNVCCLNQSGMDPLTGASGIESGDMLICISFPLHRETTKNLIGYCKDHEACIVTISESLDSAIAQEADINLVSECGDFGINGSLAPVISLCCGLICLLARNDENAQKRLKSAAEAAAYKR